MAPQGMTLIHPLGCQRTACVAPARRKDHILVEFVQDTDFFYQTEAKA